MSSYLMAIAIVVLVVSPVLIPIGVTVVDALANLRTNRRDAGTVTNRRADAGDSIQAPSLEPVAA